MKRMFALTVIASFLLVGVSAVFAAPVQGAPTGGKSLYSTRKAPVYRTVQPMIVEFDEVVMPQDGTIEMIAPQRAPEPPAPPKAGSGTLAPATTLKTPVLPTQPTKSEPIKAEKTESKPAAKPEGETWDLSKAIDESLNRPLSGISIPTPPKKEPLPEWNPSEKKPASQPAPKSVVIPEPAEVDQFNARLAKIQLEKKNLDETLRLIEKIKSPNFKVKTLVDLAEYVSRDGNYKKEADRLYALAVGAIDDLAANKPIVLDIKKAEPVKTETPKSTPPSQPKGSLTLIDEDEPAEKPKLESKKEEQKASTPPPATKPLTLIDENEPDELPKPEPKKEEKKPSTPPPATRPLTLIDENEPDELPKPEPKKEEKKASAPPPTTQSLTLIDEDDEPEAKKPETSTPETTRKPLVKEIDEKKDAVEPAPKEKEDEKKSEVPKTQRRPMPGRKPIVLSDE